MTVAEVERHMKGWEWRMKTQAQFDYKLADLIGVSVARVVSNDVNFPSIGDCYPHLFDEDMKKAEEKQKEVRMESSINNFLAFAQKHNAKISKGAETE